MEDNTQAYAYVTQIKYFTRQEKNIIHVKEASTID